MKVLFIEQFGTGGLAHYVYGLCQALGQRGVDVTLLTSDDYELADLEHDFAVLDILPLWNPWASDGGRRQGRIFRLLVVASKGLRYLWGLLLSLYTIWRMKPDIVHLSEMKFLGDLLLTFPMGRVCLVQTCHNVQRFVERQEQEGIVRARGAWYWAQRLMYRRVDGVIFHAEANRREFQEVFGFSPAASAIIPQGGVSLFVPSQPVAQVEARAALDLPPRSPLILFFGTLRRYKGIPTLLQAMARLRKGMPEVKLVVAGAPFHEVDLDAFFELESALRLSGRVIWRIEYVPNGQVPLYFRACDVIALPYTKAYDSAVLKIAQPLGVPAVVTDTGGLAAGVEGGRAGVIVPPSDPLALAEALEQVLTDPERAGKLAARGEELVRERLNWDRSAQRTEAFYREVMASCAS